MRTSTFAMVIAVTPACIDNSIPIGLEDTGHALTVPSAVADSAEHEGEQGASWGLVQEHSAGEFPRNAATDSRSSGAECGPGDLVFEAEVRDAVGEAVDGGFSIDEHRLWARVHNPCTSAVAFDTESRCLVKGWRIEVHGSLFTGAFPCGGAGGTRTVAAESFIEQEVMALHDLTEGEYALSVVFGHAANPEDDLFEAAVDFAILSRAHPQAPR